MSIHSTGDMVAALQEMRELVDKVAEKSAEAFGPNALTRLTEALHYAAPGERRIDPLVESIAGQNARISEGLLALVQAIATATDRVIDAKRLANKNRTSNEDLRF